MHHGSLILVVRLAHSLVSLVTWYEWHSSHSLSHRVLVGHHIVVLIRLLLLLKGLLLLVGEDHIPEVLILGYHVLNLILNEPLLLLKILLLDKELLELLVSVGLLRHWLRTWLLRHLELTHVEARLILEALLRHGCGVVQVVEVILGLILYILLICGAE